MLPTSLLPILSSLLPLLPLLATLPISTALIPDPLNRSAPQITPPPSLRRSSNSPRDVNKPGIAAVYSEDDDNDDNDDDDHHHHHSSSSTDDGAGLVIAHHTIIGGDHDGPTTTRDACERASASTGCDWSVSGSVTRVSGTVVPTDSDNAAAPTGVGMGKALFGVAGMGMGVGLLL
ncbi:MAG: hypothetical protein MMC23_001505 [Stictis urceolatum]|nr:hypothetical protein [Stictis urceolata]